MAKQLQPGARAPIDRVKVNCAETMRNCVREVHRCPLPARELFFYFADRFPVRTILRWLWNCGCVANTVIQTGQRQFVLFGSFYLQAFQRCRTGCNQLENRICNTSESQRGADIAGTLRRHDTQ
jgi:hypothetical protein